MKRIEDQTYYDLLEVNPGASPKEIQRAYEHAKQTFQTDSLAIYSLFSEDEAKKIEGVVEEAYQVLKNETARKDYDRSHPEALKGEDWEESFEVEDVPEVGEGPALLFTDLSSGSAEGAYRGKTLKTMREKMGIDLGTVALETKINPKTLELIEEEAWEKLPAVVYLKGFLRAYALCLGLDPQKVTDEYLKSMSEGKKK